MIVSSSIKFIGVNDKNIDLFESIYKVPHGVSYNSYVIIDEQVAVVDSVDSDFTGEWLDRLDAALDGREVNYLIVQHMEPDHSAGIAAFAEKHQGAKIVSSAKAFAMMKGFFGTDFSERRIVVTEGDTLSLGKHTLTFITAPMVHWPEVIMTYESTERVLFSADAFGKFGALDADEPWEDEARRYYIGIVGKYGVQVQNVLKKAAALDIAVICPLHGPVLKENLAHYVNLYDTWSSYRPEEDGVVIAYGSVYGNTAKAARLLADELKSRGCKVALYDLARCDTYAAVADAFRYSKLVLAAASYNADVFPAMREFITHLTDRGYKSRTVSIIENGSWAPTAAKVMRSLLEGAKDVTFTEAGVKILSAPNGETEAQITALADALCG
ncbi:MAG: FprA family A-type flavoprotein [Clostridia bacterium]|nr:FprA family A-type flavoprotein [Clostridia bacterium]